MKFIGKLSLICAIGFLGTAGVTGPSERGAPEQRESALSLLADGMRGGSWAELRTDGPGSLLRAPPPSKGLDIATWSDDAHWDSRSRQFLFMGLRQTRRFIAYSEATNSWRDIPLPDDHTAANSPPLASKYGHVYSRNALDPKRGRFYHMDHNEGGGIYRYDIDRGAWAKLPPGGNYGMTGVIEYFSAMDGLVNLASGKDGIRFFSEKDQQWRNLGPVAVHGHHTLGRHNPFREEVLLAGGNATPRTVVILGKDGRVRQARDAPVDLTIRYDLITVDPVSGRYLILDPVEKRLYDFDSRTDEYRLVDDFSKTPWPFGHYDAPLVAFIPEYGVTMWVASKVWLYKHDAPATR